MKTKRYIDILENLIKNYNNTYHRSIKSNPASVIQTNEAEISDNLYPQNPVSNKKAKFKIGNRVRVFLFISLLVRQSLSYILDRFAKGGNQYKK